MKETILPKILVNNQGSLMGRVEVSGSKNAVLPLLAATLLTDETCVLDGVPNLRDVDVMCRLLEFFGAEVTMDPAASRIEVRAGSIATNIAQQDLVKSMRASIVAMGPLLARTGQAGIPLPGGCAIGERPIDLHLKGFAALGAEIRCDKDESGDILVSASASHLIGAEVYLDFASVGATENIMMAAALAEGTTVIENPAQEPEIVDLANFLNRMGAHIRGAGTDNIRIEGVSRLHGAEHTVIPDRIEAATFMLAAAITRGDVVIENMLSNHVVPVIAKLKECGIRIEEDYNGLRVDATRNDFRATNIKTIPYPGFPTDVQPQFMAFLSTVPGRSIVIETVFENRFMHIRELNMMNACITEDGRRAVIKGGAKLTGAHVRATDLRAGAALVLAGLAAEGVTEISDIYHIDRGYDGFVSKLAGLGAGITRTKPEHKI
ncbi:MAG: UDP-N-acetylglucosamine 1-carboxyvinyltransferase [Clostridiales Family XIII bacterium]|jgi:UDP-N-acetylglucosamine 1-carboxyvinyltransferase|nr:UDP-N-acetylglucosamine 1-carboxyvinyltransferase [Clostridiales Family XIII bacterium]